MTVIDLAIVGGGPAGLATAIRGCMAGLTVRLFERASPPIDKPCGEGLMPDGVSSLEELGLEPSVLGRPFTGIRYVADETVATGLFPDRAGLGIRRTTLHSALANVAEKLGASLHWSATVEGIDQSTVRTTDGPFAAHWIVGADGLHSRVRQWLGIGVRHGRRRFGVRQHFEIEPWSDLVEVYWGESRQAYVTPVDDRQVGIALLWSNEKARFESLLAAFPQLESRLRTAPASSRKRGTGPLWAVPDRIRHGHVALVGDAAGYLDAITGEGLSLAFHHSKALVDAITSGRPADYDDAVRRLNRWPGLLIRTLLQIDRRPRLRRRLIRTLAENPQVFSRFLAIHARHLRPHQLGLSHAGRLLKGLASPW